MIPGTLRAIELEENTEQPDLLDYEARRARWAEIRKAQEEVDSPTGTRRAAIRELLALSSAMRGADARRRLSPGQHPPTARRRAR